MVLDVLLVIKITSTSRVLPKANNHFAVFLSISTPNQVPAVSLNFIEIPAPSTEVLHMEMLIYIFFLLCWNIQTL
jgi:hypothetical protein